MIPRYTLPGIAAIWSDQAKYKSWLDVELAHCLAMEGAGLVPSGTAVSVGSLIPERLDEVRILELEQETRHDVVAFLAYLGEVGGPGARWLHFGLTSSDVVDTAFSRSLVRANGLLLAHAEMLMATLAQKAKEHARTPMIGRTHGMHAEPTTFGMAMASHLAEVGRARDRMARSGREMAVGKLSGAVGTYLHTTPSVEADALNKLGLVPDTVSTQVIARDRHAELFFSYASMAAAVERLAVNVRHWQRSEVREVSEPKARGQRGSSAMPHKSNPIISENLCGLSRIVRAAVAPALENVPLWHERDISHSSVERHIAPDVTSALGYMLARAANLVSDLVVNAESMARHIRESGESFYSEPVMLELVRRGVPRLEAHRVVQEAHARAAKPGEWGQGFLNVMEHDPSIRAVIPETGALASLFNLEESMDTVGGIVGRAVEKYWK